MTYKDTRTYSDRAEYLKKAVTQRRKKLMCKAIKYAGGQCVLCGYKKSSRALHFHHLDPDTKLFGISQKGITRAWKKVVQEIDKCILLCANCHAEVHDNKTQLPDRKTGRKRR